MSESGERIGPIGVFDSGVGGLTVAGALIRRFPTERLLYVADQAHVPYGERPLDEVRSFATGISEFLAAQGCRAIVMACNISSATALESVESDLSPLPVLGVISSVARKLALQSSSPRIGVLATEGTVRSGAYTAQIHSLNPHAVVHEVPCPQFVPLVEMGEADSAEAEDAGLEYLRPLALAGCDTVVLGCTHYPFLLPALKRAASALFSGDVAFIDPADDIADALAEALPDVGWYDLPIPESRHLLLTSGDADTFNMQIPGFLPGVEYEVGQAAWQAGRLSLEGRVTAAA